MGRPYQDELALLEKSYAWARAAEITPLAERVAALRARPLLVVGSGGSVSACHFVARLHETHARLPARVITPLEFVQLPALQDTGVLLLSAGGRNPDVLAAGRRAAEAEYAEVVGLCTRAETRLRGQLSAYRHATVFEFAGPSEKDGFLATNSLILTTVLLARAYGVEFPSQLPALQDGPSADAGSKMGRAHVVALASGWSSAAGADLESKWAELGLGTVSVVDPRNFAHGRHHGLARRVEDVVVVSMSTDGERETVERTLKVLPRNVITVDLASPLSGEAGAVDLLVTVIRLTGDVAGLAGLDPGRPRVPGFGRTLYNQGIPRHSWADELDLDPCDLWIRRKVSPVLWATSSPETREAWRTQCREWIHSAQRMPIGGLVFDYDGTLCEAEERFGNPSTDVGRALTRLVDEGVVVGVATGRGDSVIDALRVVVPPRAWGHILVGMYNGSVLQRLDEVPRTEQQIDPSIQGAHDLLSESPLLACVAKLRLRPTQVTVRAAVPMPAGLLRQLVVETLEAYVPNVGVFASGHTVDVIASSSSKLRVVAEVRRQLLEAGGPATHVMTIGDQGQAGGNDGPFLAHPLGLSVENTSTNFAGCWNVAPAGARRTVALLGYLAALRRARSGGFRFSAERASRKASLKDL
jgi:fructoselysine-6-P-deglycase FrlB-like protein